MGKQAIVSHTKSSVHIWNVAEKSGNLIMTVEWPPWDHCGGYWHQAELKSLKWCKPDNDDGDFLLHW